MRGRAAVGRGEEGGEEVGEGMGRLWGQGDRGRLAEGTLPAAGWLGKEGRRKPSQPWWVPDGGPGVRREAPLRRAVR